MTQARDANGRSRHADPPRILVMDDEAAVRSILVDALVELGYRVEGASSGEEALRLFRHARSTGQPFDLMILDLTVREGMGGLETLRSIEAMDPHPCAILSSGCAAEPALHDPSRYGFVGSLRKPYRFVELEAAVRAALDAPRSAALGTASASGASDARRGSGCWRTGKTT